MNAAAAAAAAAASKSIQSCLTLGPHRGQPTRLLCALDSPGKNNGVGCHFFSSACMHANSLHSYLILCTPMDSSPPGFSDHRILQARILKWVTIFFSH